jgi:DNA-binding Lrp family transcriptional regulator
MLGGAIMTTRAHVLITTEVGQAAAVAEGVRTLPGVCMADVVSGPYDIILTIEGSSLNDIGKVVLNKIHGMPGLKATTTLIALT